MFTDTDAEGSRDGLASPVEICKPAGLCVEFDHVLSMCDAQTNCIKVFTTLNETAAFLDVVGKLSPSTRSMQSTSSATYKDVVTLLKEKEALHYLRRNEALIRGKIPSLPRSLNVPQWRPKRPFSQSLPPVCLDTFSMTYSPRKQLAELASSPDGNYQQSSRIIVRQSQIASIYLIQKYRA